MSIRPYGSFNKIFTIGSFLKKCMFAFLLTQLFALWLLAREGVWTWVKDPVECPELNGALYMAYDEARQQPALMVVHYLTDDPWYHALFHYDGRQWQKTWEGKVDSQYWADPIGFYYDPEIQQLVYAGYITYGFEQAFMGIYRYQEGQGWSLGPKAALNPVRTPGVVYDTARRLAVMIGLSDWSGKPMTVEFDGQNFVQKPMPEGVELYYGRIGYDTESGQTIFFGRNNESSENNETFAYDGCAWGKVPTAYYPPQPYSTISGMIYHPILHGLLSVTSSLSISETWIYGKGEWSRISLQDSPSARVGGAISYDPLESIVLLSGGTARMDMTIETGWAFDTWQLCRVIHSKPVSKPKP